MTRNNCKELKETLLFSCIVREIKELSLYIHSDIFKINENRTGITSVEITPLEGKTFTYLLNLEET